MNFRFLVLLALALAIGTPVSADESSKPTSEAKASDPLRALLVTGGCCHDYPRQAEIITKGMNERIGRIEWTVVNYGTERTGELAVYANPNWAAEYDIVVHNECYGGVTDPAVIQRIVEGHAKAGVPAIAVHCSMHSYRAAENADLWRALLGVTSTYHEKAKRSLAVVPVMPEHPILKGFPETWNTPNGELYIIERTWPATEVLATAYSTETEKDQPVAWVNEHQGVRVFATTLGHHNVTMESPEWLNMVALGMQWAMEKPKQ
ncbi:ThuA domain-containing protein [Candidatus Laterigemmans baculatus]|uniref:ThuA domain-containing protein n=1 Tax=Candidatus Laterigemmans baculatus TaxID=2770505 RepID=UPI0013DCCAA3|nr:ThuA domain-containing protein [Candidatus Laterigemmans baculatus]